MFEAASHTAGFHHVGTLACLLTSSGLRAGARKKQQGQAKAENATANPRKRKGSLDAESDAAPAAKKARQAPLGTAKRKVGRPRTNVQLLRRSASVPGAGGGLPADDVQHGGEPFLIVGRNDTTGVRYA